MNTAYNEFRGLASSLSKSAIEFLHAISAERSL